jgi:hypothetical protein
MKERLRDKIGELAANSKNNNFRDLCRGINEFKKGYQLRSNLVKMRMEICLQIPIFWIGEELLLSVTECTKGQWCEADINI